MKEILKQELMEYSEKIDKRIKFIDNELKDLKLFYEIGDSEVNKKISRIVINFLKEKNWNFEKQRTIYGSQLYLEDNMLLLRAFKHKHKSNINFLSDTKNLGEVISLLPDGFAFGVEQISKLIDEHNKLEEKFKPKKEEDSYNYGYRRGRSYHNSYYDHKNIIIKKTLKGKFDIINSWRSEEEEIEEITAIADSYGSDIKLNIGDRISSQVLYYDEIYNKTLQMIDNIKAMSNEAKQQHDNTMAQIINLTEEDKFRSLMMAYEL